MRFSIDPVPIGAFIEYTLKPLIDDARTLLEILEKHDIKARDAMVFAVWLYVLDMCTRIILTFGTLGLICFTVLHYLPTTR